MKLSLRLEPTRLSESVSAAFCVSVEAPVATTLTTPAFFAFASRTTLEDPVRESASTEETLSRFASVTLAAAVNARVSEPNPPAIVSAASWEPVAMLKLSLRLEPTRLSESVSAAFCVSVEAPVATTLTTPAFFAFASRTTLEDPVRESASTEETLSRFASVTLAAAVNARVSEPNPPAIVSAASWEPVAMLKISLRLEPTRLSESVSADP